jgi:hypothetical protein
MNGFLLGNGESRRGIKLDKLKLFGPVYGCNALYRDFKPDTLFSVDPLMVKRILGDHYDGEFIYRKVEGSRREMVVHGTDIIYEDNGWASGPTALRIMCERFSDLQNVFLIGFDLYGNSGKVNNLYKDTECYLKSSDQCPNAEHWIEQLCAVFLINEQINFYRVGNINDEFPSLWKKTPNAKFISYPEMALILAPFFKVINLSDSGHGTDRIMEGGHCLITQLPLIQALIV